MFIELTHRNNGIKSIVSVEHIVSVNNVMEEEGVQIVFSNNGYGDFIESYEEIVKTLRSLQLLE